MLLSSTPFVKSGLKILEVFEVLQLAEAGYKVGGIFDIDDVYDAEIAGGFVVRVLELAMSLHFCKILRIE